MGTSGMRRAGRATIATLLAASVAVVPMVLARPVSAQETPAGASAGPVRIRTYLNQSAVAARPPADDGGANAILARAQNDMAAGRNVEAEAGFRRSLDILKTRASTPSDQVEAVTSMLAFLLASTGRTAEAEALARPIDLGGLPPAHAARQRASFVLAIAAATQGRYLEAAERLKGLVDMALAGDDRETAGQVSVMLAAAYRTLGRNQDAIDAMAVATLPTGPMTDLARLRQAADSGGTDAAIAAADALIALPRRQDLPDSLRAYALAERARMLTRRARQGSGPGASPDLVEAERSLRSALAAGLAADTPLMNVGLQEALGMTLLAGAGDSPTSAPTLEGLDLLKTVAERREQLLGVDNPAAVGSRVDYAVWLSVANQGDQALKIMDAMAARADAAPGLMSRERRGILDVSRASIMMRELRLGDSYLTLRAAGLNLQAYALAPERRDDARETLAGQSSIYRTQVLLGFLTARELASRSARKR